MTDIVERLKERLSVGGVIPIGSTLISDAIAEIERLRGMIEEEGYTWEPDPRTPEEIERDHKRFMFMLHTSPEVMEGLIKNNALLASLSKK